MTFFTICLAFIIAYFLPRPLQLLMGNALMQYGRWFESKFNSGLHQHTLIAWIVGALLPSMLVASLYIYAYKAHTLFGLVIGVFVFSLSLQHTYILFEPDTPSADTTFAMSIEQRILRSFEGFFAPLLWTAMLGMLIGPAGALLYRLTQVFRYAWQESAHLPSLDNWITQLVDVINWVPSRICAGGFAIVGDFEDAIYCWREQSQWCSNHHMGALLCSGAGALGVILPVHVDITQPTLNHPEIGIGEFADADYLKSATGMIWRVLILLIAVVLLLSLASWLG